ncbi:MAG: response regulator [Planctomycetia bacterium]|nr:response regulator [Planctomycetia bacterium]
MYTLPQDPAVILVIDGDPLTLTGVDTHGQEDVPVLFVSSAQMPDIIRRTHDAGGTYYLRKPFDPDVLIELVGKALWMPHLVKSRFERHEPARSTPRPSGLHRQRSDVRTTEFRD